MLDTATFISTTQDFNALTLTPAAQAAVSINDKHREVQRLGRTAKEIAAEIGEELIEVKQKLVHGQFGPWIKVECSFNERMARNYMVVAEVKRQRVADFNRCESIREVLALGKPKPEPKPELRAATFDDLRKVEGLRALRDDPSATEGEKANAQAKLDEIEKEVGKVELEKQVNKEASYASWEQKRASYSWKMETFFIDRIAMTFVNKAQTDAATGGNAAFKELKKILRRACGGDAKTIDELLHRVEKF